MKKKLKSNKINFFPVSKPYVSKQDIAAVNKVLKNGWISSNGPEINKFEKEFSKLVNRKYSTTVSNGTGALEIAIKALGIKKGDEVLIPNFTIISNALAVIKQQATPILIDCNLDNWNIKIEDIEKKITKKTKAIIITHIYSFPNDMDKILKICKKNKILLIEDAAEVIGSTYKNKKCGSFGDISTFSFYANKQITTGEGGMISTNSKSLYNKCNSLKNLCFGKINRFNHDDIGWNYRMTNMQAALGLSQLKNIKKTVKKKIEIGNHYYKTLSLNKNIQILPPSNSYSKNIYWVIGIIVKNKKINIKSIVNKLLSFGIQTRPFFWKMNEQIIFKKLQTFNNTNNKYPNSKYLSHNGFYLPSYLELKKKEIDFICNAVNKVINIELKS